MTAESYGRSFYDQRSANAEAGWPKTRSSAAACQHGGDEPVTEHVVKKQQEMRRF